jgi:hypothetical protein
VSLLTESGDTKDDLRLPSDEQLLAQVAFLPMQIPLFSYSSGFYSPLREFCLMMNSHVDLVIEEKMDFQKFPLQLFLENVKFIVYGNER